jgi:hypothetical protein
MVPGSVSRSTERGARANLLVQDRDVHAVDLLPGLGTEVWSARPTVVGNRSFLPGCGPGNLLAGGIPTRQAPYTSGV